MRYHCGLRSEDGEKFCAQKKGGTGNSSYSPLLLREAHSADC